MPIALSKEEWARIVKWTCRDREPPEVTRRREYIKYLEETSKKMTRSWPNSLENVNKRNEELRLARIQVAEQANSMFYKRYLKRKKEEQVRLMYSARDTVFKDKDAPKLLLSAVIETVVQKERMEQIKFLNKRRRELAEQKKREDDEIIKKAKEWHQLMAERKKRRFEANKHHQKEICEQAHEVSERNRREYETELNLQKTDNMKADQEMAAIKQFEQQYKDAEKARIWSDMERSRLEGETRRQEQAARDSLDDQLLDVLLKSNARVERRRKQTEKEIRDEKLRVLENISQRLESGDAAREAKELAILNKAIKEKEAIAELRRQANERKADAFRAARQQARDQFLRDEQRRLHELSNARQWDIMNRFKNAELYDNFKEKERNEKERSTKEYREDLLTLWKEREEREARERAERRHFYGPLAEQKLRAADNRLLAHAAALLREADHHRRPAYPIHRAVDHYCKLYRLYPMPVLPSSLQEHCGHYAPRDLSAPDPGYREPTPPPPDAGPDAPDEPEAAATRTPPNAAHKRDGLMEPVTPSSKKWTDSVADYKRAGPANGLQRKDEVDVILPPIQGVKCCCQPE